MSKPESKAEAEARAARDAREETWCGWVLRPTPKGWVWARVLLPRATLEKHLIGPLNTPDTKAIALSKIESDMRSDSVTTRRGWVR